MTLRRLVATLAAAASTLALAGTASGGATIPVSMTFTEPVAKPGCTISFGFCGSGEVVPLGQATETIEFTACGETCDLRTITLAGGTILSHETAGHEQCPGNCRTRGVGVPSTVAFTDVIVGGTGIFAGATGSLSGEVVTAGGANRIKLAGTTTLADP
jgi:hypothetical protein